MKNFIKLSILGILILFAVQAAGAFTLTESGGSDPRSEAWSNNWQCSYDQNYNCVWNYTPVRIGVKHYTGAEANKWIVLPKWDRLNPLINTDIDTGVQEIINNNIPARWGQCQGGAAPSWLNMTNCLY